MQFKNLIPCSLRGIVATHSQLCQKLMVVAALTVAAAGAAHAQAYANITVGGAFAPGVFGQISIGNNPPPPVLNVQPIIVGAPVYGAAPMYLHVSQDEYRDWGRHCGRYRACGHPVHFVRVEENNRWWDHHGEHLRGRSYYRQAEERRDERRYEHRHEYRNDYKSDNRRDFDKDPRFEARRGER